MYFVKIQRISDTLNPYKSPIWPKTESVEGCFLICRNFQSRCKAASCVSRKVANTRLSSNKLEEEHFSFALVSFVILIALAE
jgi:hypothetical protein